MDRISKVFSTGNKALIVYLTAGYPSIGPDEELAITAIDAGADILELGFPFSDPIADGPLIQEASHKALENGMTLAGAIGLTGRIRDQRDVPIILMGYANPVHHMGYDTFSEKLAQAGGDGAIIPDLPMETSAPLRDEMRKRGLDRLLEGDRVKGEGSCPSARLCRFRHPDRAGCFPGRPGGGRGHRRFSDHSKNK
jgi:tryptophan synthase alpha chain